jgi:hypothetical protein
MFRWARYLSLWRTLPEPERRARAGRVADRLIQRGALPAPLRRAIARSSRAALRRACTVDPREIALRLRDAGAERGPLFAAAAPRAREVARRFPDHAAWVLRRTERLLEREFELLGAPAARPLLTDGRIDWHTDWVSGSRWDAGAFAEDLPLVREGGVDVKRPWELARFQHLLVLGQARHLASLEDPHGSSASLPHRAAVEAAAQIDMFIADNPRAMGIHWSCAMEIALRALSWCAALALFRDSETWTPGFVERMVHSLWQHGLHVRRNLETGGAAPATNHYLADLLGLLALARTLPELRDAAEWETLAVHELEREIERQVHADGVGFERSLSYHRLAAEIFVHAMLLAPDRFGAAFRTRLAAMLEFSAACTRPDGTVPRWGDDDRGRVLPIAGYGARTDDHRELLDLGGRVLERRDLVAAGAGRSIESAWLLEPCEAAPGTPDRTAETASREFPEAGVCVLRGSATHVLTSCGPVGTAGLGNHGHNDLLAVCLWAGGREWITDPGTGSYGGDIELRRRLRSVAAHATVQLGEREPHGLPPGPAGLFRMVGRARAEVERYEPDRWVARHDGFRGGDCDWIHRRELRLDPVRNACTILDRVWREPPRAAPADERLRLHLRFPLADGVRARVDPPRPPAGLGPPPDGARSAEASGTPRAVLLEDDIGRRLWLTLSLPRDAVVEIASAEISPGYGERVEGGVLVVQCAATGDVSFSTVLQPEPRADTP